VAPTPQFLGVGLSRLNSFLGDHVGVSSALHFLGYCTTRSLLSCAERVCPRAVNRPDAAQELLVRLRARGVIAPA
jgi:hypothetical protein